MKNEDKILKDDIKNKVKTNEKGNIDNRICLCISHHKLFDKKYLFIDDDYIIINNYKGNCKYIKNFINSSI